ncbi:rod shape-determining protein RodA [Caenispirillum bisanense]|uniref:rod shape-determining protein RodA n=1 Tax=Caenispirillum bisanense TaxID=414052 RepID=UPI0031E0A7CB
MSEFLSHRRRRGDMTTTEKLWQVSWSLVFLITLIASVGFLMLYSAANGSWDPWANRQIMRFAIGLAFMLGIALIDVRQLMKWSYTAYGIAFVLLVAVEVRGEIGMGAQRWIDLGIFQLQPSELMKVSLVLALARYFHGASLEDVGRPLFLVPPMLLVFAPAALVLKQPDLGTALMLIAGSGVTFFMAGVRLWKFALVLAAGMAAVPVAWNFLRDYQKNRVLTFLNPESDPLGTGYHILQSKIALGSGGVFGKGFLQGTQSHLNFLPERQTDFIFTMMAEEFGMAGGIILLGLYVVVLIYGFVIALRSRHQFGRLVAIGVTTTFFLYVFINIAMVMGLIPVVGVPLPLISYGGTAMLTLLIAFGCLMSVHIHRDVQIGRRGGYDEP